PGGTPAPPPAADSAGRAAASVAEAAPPPPAAPAAPAVAADAPLAERLAALAPDADSGGRRITLEDLVFEPGTATFAGGADVGVARVAVWLAASPALSVRIEGHTDATGSPEANLSLSLRRAEAVRDALVARGIAAARIVVSGEGGADPVASNDDAQGRARNRRVVVELLDGG
ncbi:OmpA family protein, partial [Tahibacter caeni]|uniref:OmpA family protein n=1 Tax=Tahibacter caeni TaxID=1453545 RepID=UPI002148FAD2